METSSVLKALPITTSVTLHDSFLEKIVFKNIYFDLFKTILERFVLKY